MAGDTRDRCVVCLAMHRAQAALSGLSTSEGCILSYSDHQETQEVPQICFRGQNSINTVFLLENYYEFIRIILLLCFSLCYTDNFIQGYSWMEQLLR